MDINALASAIGRLSDAQLQTMLRPGSPAPEYLVAAELAQRKAAREAVQTEPNTVADYLRTPDPMMQMPQEMPQILRSGFFGVENPAFLIP